MRVKLAASGMCHSDEHLVTGDLPFALPIIGGHEGAGVVEEVGEGVSWLAAGRPRRVRVHPVVWSLPELFDRVIRACAISVPLIGLGMQIADGTSRHHAQGDDLGLMCMLGTFAHHTVVNEASCIKIENDVAARQGLPARVWCRHRLGFERLRRRCRPGDIVCVVGVGGIGANAIQGAKLAGAKQIWAIDPVEYKREKAMEFGATHTAASMAEAMEPLGAASWGTMANKVIMTMGVGSGEVLIEALALTAKRGRVVVTNIHPAMEMSANVSLLDLTLMEKQVVGSLFGSGNPRADIPKLLNLYREGQLDLDGLVTKTYTLDGVNDGYDDMRAGKNIRGVMVYS